MKGQESGIEHYINLSCIHKIKKRTCYSVIENDKKILSVEEYNEFGKIIKYIDYDVEDNSINHLEYFSYLNDTTITKLQEIIYSRFNIDYFLNYTYDKNRELFKELKKYKLDSLELITNYKYVQNKVIVLRKFKNSVVDFINIDNPFLVEKAKSDSKPRNYYCLNNEIVSKRVLKNKLIEENHYRKNDSLLISTSRYLLNETEKVCAYRDTLLYDKQNRLINQTVLYSVEDYFPNISFLYSLAGDTIIKTETYPIKQGYKPWITKQILINGKLAEQEINKTKDNFIWWERVLYNSQGLSIEHRWNDRGIARKEHKLIYEYVYK